MPSESFEAEASFSQCIDVSKLPKCVKDRVKALKKLQFGVLKSEAEYYREVHQLDLKYQRIYDSINAEREKVVNGQHEPSGDEIDWPSDAEDEDAEDNLANGVENLALNDYDENTKGIPKFWYHVLKNANDDCLMSMVEPTDEEALRHLTDVTVKLSDPGNNEFVLTFHFSENEFFSNRTLEKSYVLRDGPNMEAPLEYDGPEIISCKGSKIEWKEGKDLTKVPVTLNLSSAEGDAPREAVFQDSFFSFFSPPEIDEKDENVSDDDRASLAMDFDVGFAIKEKVIPRAVLYFTGDIGSDDEDYEDIEDESDDEEAD